MVEPKTIFKTTEASVNDRAPIVSIGMPVFNGAKYIREALNSLLVQTYTDFELIISDNASTDATGVICEEYARSDPRIHYVRQSQNNGASTNFQFVLDQAKGEYFMWAADDDRHLPRCVETLLNILQYDEGCSLAFSDYVTRNLETGEEVLHRVIPSNSSNVFLNYTIRLLQMCPSMIYGLFRTQCLRTIKMDSFDFSDVHMILSVACISRIRVANECLYIAGTKGIRVPYSISGGRISRAEFLRRQYALIKGKFDIIPGVFLYLLACVVMFINAMRLK